MMLGLGSRADGLMIEDIFSTYLYEGTGSSKTITTGIDQSGEGSLTWIKKRNGAVSHQLFDTARGAGQAIYSDLTSSQYYNLQRLASFTSTGFTLGTNGAVNANGDEYTSWNFRKAPGFFDIVTYTGNATNRTISHSLGSTPGMILIKCTSGNENWVVYHQDVGNGAYLKLNEDSASQTDSGGAVFNGTSPTSTTFSVGTHALTNGNTETYVAYLFANDDQIFGHGGSSGVVKVGSYTGNGSSTGPEVNLGFEPQWIMVKNADSSSREWVMWDTMRGIIRDGDDTRLKANSTEVEGANNAIDLIPTGFKIVNSASNWNENGNTIIYIAIRRPDGYVGKTPTAGNQVFTPIPGSSGAPLYKSNNHVVDFTLQKSGYNSSSSDWYLTTRPRSGNLLRPNTVNAEESNTYQVFDYQSGASSFTGGDGSRFSWLFKRGPGLDIQYYTGITGQQSRVHGLNAVPEMIWAKSYNNAYNWAIGHKDLTGGWTSKHLRFTTSAEITGQQFALAPTKTHWTTPNGALVNDNGEEYVAILFSSVKGISKVGSYSVSDASENKVVDVGFAPRFVLIKRRNADSTNWVVADSYRGSSDGNTPLLFLNSDATQAYATQMYFSGNTFVIKTGSAGGQLLDNGGEYIYYAHA